MVKKQAKQFLFKVTKELLRRSPQRVQNSLQRAVAESLQSGVSSSSSPSLTSNTTEVFQEQSELYISPEDLGTTYEKDLVLPMLALENTVLHSLLNKNRQELNALRDSDLEEHATGQRPQDALRQEYASKLAEDYLAGQPEGMTRHLVLANEYPREGKEYGNGFIHQRVKHYLEAGVAVDVVCAGYSVEQDLYTYDGVRVLSGHGEEITEILKRQAYTSVSVHFLNARIWNALEPFLASLEVHLFLHGYECSRWIRRRWDYKTGKELEEAIERSIGRQNFWREVLHHPHQPKSYIFVSDWWRQAVFDDMRLTFPSDRVHIVHNYINSDLFTYHPKTEDQRFKLLWLRPATNRKYANDIAVDILEKLSRSEYWNRCQVTIIGDGKHFSEFEKLGQKFRNIDIERRFVSQQEVAALYKEHGVLLVPSRLDSQGVSRDEAMSSGLVPVTNLVTAIPEFVDSQSGIVAESENADDLAAGILDLWQNPEKFRQLSESAARRVRRQSGREATVEREMAILGLKKD